MKWLVRDFAMHTVFQSCIILRGQITGILAPLLHTSIIVTSHFYSCQGNTTTIRLWEPAMLALGVVSSHRNAGPLN